MKLGAQAAATDDFPRLAANMDRFNYSYRFHGFTLIELMIVLLLISIVTAVAVPRFQDGAFQDPVKKSSRWITSAVRALRTAAVQKQKPCTLAIDLENRRLWTISADMDESAQVEASKKAFSLPGSLRIVEVRFPDDQRVSTGVAEINFYPAGYSDRAILEAEDGDANRYAFLIEPLLPKVKYFEKWISF